VPGLDEILGGGLMKAGVYIIQGEPGAGKTILANQVCFHHVAGGGTVAYVTLLSESHARMIQHLEQLSFFRADAIPDSIHYVSAFTALKTEGLVGVTRLLTDEMRRRKADLLVLDGLVTAAGASGSSETLKVFVSEIQAHSALAGCTTLLLNSVGGPRSRQPRADHGRRHPAAAPGTGRLTLSTNRQMMAESACSSSNLRFYLPRIAFTRKSHEVLEDCSRAGRRMRGLLRRPAARTGRRARRLRLRPGGVRRRVLVRCDGAPCHRSGAGRRLAVATPASGPPVPGAVAQPYARRE